MGCRNPAFFVLPMNAALYDKFVNYHIGSYGVAVAFFHSLCSVWSIWKFIQEADIQWNMTVLNAQMLKPRADFFPGHKSRIFTAPVMAPRTCWYQYWYPEITMKIIKTFLPESLEFALKSNLLKVTDPYNVKLLSMTDPSPAIWPIRATVVTNIACFCEDCETTTLRIVLTNMSCLRKHINNQ